MSPSPNPRHQHKGQRKSKDRSSSSSTDDYDNNAHRNGGGSSSSWGRETRTSIFDITSIDTSFTSAVESVVVSPMHGLTSAVREVLLATEGAVTSTGEAISANMDGVVFFTGSAGSRSMVTSKQVDKSIECDVDEFCLEEDDADEKKSEDHEPPAVNIRHFQNGGAEVELVSNDLSPVMDSSNRGSVALQTENPELMTMNLRILRAKGLPFEAARVTIHLLDDPLEFNNNHECFETDEDGRPVVDKDIGSTLDVRCPSGEAIWGGPRASWTLRGSDASKFVFEIVDASSTMKDRDTNSNENVPLSRICVKVFAVDLLNGGVNQSPNCWLKLRDCGPAGIEDCGCLEVRLINPPDATLHDQENCPRILPGPHFSRMQSYAIRKLALYSVSPVMLNVYDVSNNPRIRTINNTTKSLGYGGIFHAAIEIHGREYSFGGTLNKHSDVTGIFASPSKRCPMHHYRESVYLGDCELNPDQVRLILEVMRPHWKAKTYNLFRKNCAFFSRELAVELGVGDIPEWVWSLASTAEKFEPTLLQINSYLRMPVRTNRPSPKKKNIGLAGDESDEVEKVERAVAAVLRENDSDRKGLNIATSTQENLLDHAMAARIQRSFRAANGPSTAFNLKRSPRFLPSRMNDYSSRSEMSL
jgi:deubiquitinase DESI2